MMVLQALLTAFFIILLLGGLALLIYSRVDAAKNKKYRLTGEERRLVLAVKDIKEDSPISLLSSEDEMVYQDFLDLLKQIEKDKDLKEIILDIDNIQLTASQLEEIRPIFRRMRESKKIKALATKLDKKAYKTALLADEIYMFDSNNSSFTLRGFNKMSFYKKEFFEKLGIKLTPIHIGDYKSAYEDMARDEMSPEKRQSQMSLGRTQDRAFIDLVKEERGIDIEEDLLEGRLIFLNRSQAKEKGLVDGEASYEDLGLDNNKENMSLKKYRKNVKDKKVRNKDANIALINLEGNISSMPTRESYISYKNVKKKVDSLKDYKDLEGLILRINSRGGMAIEAEKIYRLIKELDLKVYVSMGDYCASGGYYIACAGDKIFANKSSLLGSIGVVSLYPDLSSSLEKLGINKERVSQGRGQDLYDIFKPLTEENRQTLTEWMVEVYDEFKSRVCQARSMTDEELEPLAGGRVYYGEEGLENGLIDEIGSVDYAIDRLKEDLALDKVNLIHVRERLSMEELKEVYQLNLQSLLPEERIKALEEIAYQPLYYDSRDF